MIENNFTTKQDVTILRPILLQRAGARCERQAEQKFLMTVLLPSTEALWGVHSTSLEIFYHITVN